MNYPVVIIPLMTRVVMINAEALEWCVIQQLRSVFKRTVRFMRCIMELATDKAKRTQCNRSWKQLSRRGEKKNTVLTYILFTWERHVHPSMGDSSDCIAIYSTYSASKIPKFLESFHDWGSIFWWWSQTAWAFIWKYGLLLDSGASFPSMFCG